MRRGRAQGRRRVPCRGAVAVRLFDPQTPRAPLRGELAAALERVLDDGRYILGPEVEAFEREFAAWLGTEHVVGVANGTEAITIALRALGVGPGDEVVVPSFTFYASAEAIPPTGATPVFCDVDPGDVRRDARRRARRPHAAHEGRDPRAPVRQRRAGRGGRGARRPRARGRRAGDRLAAARRADRRAGHDRDVLLLPVEEPRRPRRRRRDRDRRRRAGRARAHAALPRLAGQGDVHGRSATTAASTSCRPPRCACSCRTCTRGARAAAPRGARTPPPGSATTSRLPVPRRRRRPGLEPLRRAPPAPRGAGRRAARRRASARARTTPCPRTASRRSPPSGATRSCPGPRRPRGPISRCRWARRSPRSRWARSSPRSLGSSERREAAKPVPKRKTKSFAFLQSRGCAGG